jgi:hypothetical protein
MASVVVTEIVSVAERIARKKCHHGGQGAAMVALCAGLSKISLNKQVDIT